MRLALLALVAGGLVPAPAGPAALTITASHTTVVYGERVELSGTVPAGFAAAPGSVVGTPFGGRPRSVASWSAGAAVWHARVRPRIRTSFSATANGETSRPVVVSVRPRVSLTARKGRFVATVVAGGSFAGRGILLQRLGLHGHWGLVRRAVLRHEPVGFRTSLPRGASRLRAFVPASPGYLAGMSKVLAVTR